MDIQRLTLGSNRIAAQKKFYERILGFNLNTSDEFSFSLQCGSSELVFKPASQRRVQYHFAFLVPTGCIESAITWLKARSIQLLKYKGEEIIPFKEGRAIYFYDAENNIVEFIERPTLGFDENGPFSTKSICKINEIGLVTDRALDMTDELSNDFGIRMIDPDWKSEDFCWVGDYNGVLIAVKEGRNWLPTEIGAIKSDFEVEIQENGSTFSLNVRDGQLEKVDAFNFAL